MKTFIPKTNTVNKDRFYFTEDELFIKVDTIINRGNNESKILNKLIGFKNVPQIIESYEENNQHILKMSFIPGETLENCHKELSLDDKIKLVKDLTKIISFLFEKNISHGDINESNIIFNIGNSGEKMRINNLISNNQATISSYQEKIQNNKNMIVRIKEEEEKEKIYKIYLEAYGKNGVSKMIMKTMMPIINSELQRLMEDSSYFKLEIRINDKNEVEFMMVDNGTGVEKLMSSGSGFERTIASLALRAVLSKVCSLPKPNIVVFDEVFGKVSNENLDMVGEFFNKIKDYFEKVFVITHNPLVTNWANSVVKISKTNNISTVSQ